MEFVLVTLGMVGLIVLCLVLLARAYPGSGADLVDWKPTRSHEVEAQLEVDDVAADDRGAERVPPPARRARDHRGGRQADGARGRGRPRARRRSYDGTLDELEDEYGV